MKRLELILILIICQGFAQGYPIHAANGAVNCTVYGEFKDPYTVVNRDNIVLNVDVSLVKSNSTGWSPAQASYSLVDSNDKIYTPRGELTLFLRPGRQLLGFAVPPRTIPKTLIVDPSGSSNGSGRLMINFGELNNATNGKVDLLYYGVLSSRIESRVQSIDFDVAVTNRGANALPLSSKNFSLLDQWGQKYDSMVYSSYRNNGFESRQLKPNETARIKVSFGSISPLSRQSRLVYEYSNTSSIVLNVDPDGGLLRNVISKNCTCPSCSDVSPKPPAINSSQEQSVLTRLSGTLKATRGVLKKETESFIKNNVQMVGGKGTKQKVIVGK